MDPEPKQVVEEFLGAAESGNRETMARLMHPEVEIIEADSLPFGGVHKGLEGFLNLARTVFTTFKDTHIEVERIISEEDYVVVVAILCGRSRHTGEPFRMPITEIWKLFRGRIIQIRPFYLDTARLNDLSSFH